MVGGHRLLASIKYPQIDTKGLLLLQWRTQNVSSLHPLFNALFALILLSAFCIPLSVWTSSSLSPGGSTSNQSKTIHTPNRSLSVPPSISLRCCRSNSAWILLSLEDERSLWVRSTTFWKTSETRKWAVCGDMNVARKQRKRFRKLRRIPSFSVNNLS